ncbi:flagellar hook-length control protein FliK [Shouchella tritolerans]|uniref:flagellar hook-length control protein FliK n=1 Tax=Shouchella tritolerans TaxID=2979466 RepID=UPI0021E8970C|nr:flagellar hook-length control protein FliK [Shouchella tritolerans]
MHITQMVNEIATSRPLGQVKGRSQSFSDLLLNKASSSTEGLNTMFLPLTNTEELDNDAGTSAPNDEQADDPVLSRIAAENQANQNQIPVGAVDFGQPSVVNEEGGSKPGPLMNQPVDSTGWDLSQTTTGASPTTLAGATSRAEAGELLENLAKEPKENDSASAKPALSQDELKDIAVRNSKTGEKEPSLRQVAPTPFQDMGSEPPEENNRTFRDKNQQMSSDRPAPLPQGDDKTEPENRAESLKREQEVALLTKVSSQPSDAMKASANDAWQVDSNSGVEDESPVRTEAEQAQVFKNEQNKFTNGKTHEENELHTERNEPTKVSVSLAEGKLEQIDPKKRIVHEKEPSTAPRIIEGPSKQTHNGTGMASGQAGIEGSAAVEATKQPSGKSALPPMLAKQLERVLRAAAFKQHGDGALQLTVKLHPETLGRLHVQLFHSSQGLVVKLLADKKATAETLERALPGLRQMVNQDATFEIGPIDEEGDEQSNGESGQEGGRKPPEDEVGEQRKQHSFSDWMSQKQGEGEEADDAS